MNQGRQRQTALSNELVCTTVWVGGGVAQTFILKDRWQKEEGIVLMKVKGYQPHAVVGHRNYLDLSQKPTERHRGGVQS